MPLESNAKFEEKLTCGLENNMRNLANEVSMKNDANIQEEVTGQFNIDIRHLTNFDPSTWKSQNSAF